MFSLAGLALLLFSGIASAAPRAVGPRSQEWTLNDFRRVCTSDGASCTYTFSISEAGRPEATACKVTAQASPGKPANHTDFTNIPCPGAPHYHVSCGWNSQGFIVIAINNMNEFRTAYFGYRDDEIQSGAQPISKTEPSYGCPGAPPSRDSEESEVHAAPADAPSSPEGVKDAEPAADNSQTCSGDDAEAPRWALRNVRRWITSSPSVVHMVFDIETLPVPLAGNSTCSLDVPIPEGVDPVVASWYNQACEIGWIFSWGYNSAGDFAVPTLVNPDRSRNAWFGFDHISTWKNESLPDVGPNLAVPL